MASLSSPARVALLVRAHYGLSQLELAQFLTVSRGLIALVETGRRELPPAAAARLVLLHSAAATAAETAPAPAEATAWEPLHLHQRKCLRQAYGLRQELAKLQTQALQYQRRLLTLPTLQPPPESAPESAASAWLTKMKAQARYRLPDCGPVAQSLLAARIAALEFEAAEVGRQAEAGLKYAK